MEQEKCCFTCANWNRFHGSAGICGKREDVCCCKAMKDASDVCEAWERRQE